MMKFSMFRFNVAAIS